VEPKKRSAGDGDEWVYRRERLLDLNKAIIKKSDEMEENKRIAEQFCDSILSDLDASCPAKEMAKTKKVRYGGFCERRRGSIPPDTMRETIASWLRHGGWVDTRSQPGWVHFWPPSERVASA